jgi:anthranilate phosphoribosyltransferase
LLLRTNIVNEKKGMKATLAHLFEHKTLTRDEAKAILISIAQGQYNHSQIASFLTVFIMRGIRLEELEGFRDAMLELCLPIDLSEFDPIDLCGTGGDGKDTFNISTLAAFVVAGAGVKVAKHGNYGVSSVSGSSNMMEHFGHRFTNEADALRRDIERANICFLHAPLFHPAMKNVGPVRRELGVKTFFNMLGPMVNPAFVSKQLVGVFSLELARLYGYLYQTGGKRFTIVHSLDGYDELSLTGTAKIIDNLGERIVQPDDFGFRKLQANELRGGGTVEASARIFMDVLEGRGTNAQNSAVVANALLALRTALPECSLGEAKEMATESLVGGQALRAFKSLLQK